MKVDQLTPLLLAMLTLVGTSHPPHPAGRMAQVIQHRNSPPKREWIYLVLVFFFFKDIIVRSFERLAKCKGQRKTGPGCAFGRTPCQTMARQGTHTAEVKRAQKVEGAAQPECSPAHPTSARFLPPEASQQVVGGKVGTWFG